MQKTYIAQYENAHILTHMWSSQHIINYNYCMTSMRIFIMSKQQRQENDGGTFLFRDRSSPFRRRPVVRRLQQNYPVGSFGPPSTQYGTHEEEEDDGSIVTPMEEKACLEGRRRRLLAMVVA